MIKNVFLIGLVIVVVQIITVHTVNAIATQQPTNQGLVYLAMGDSFTSGEGETSDSYYLPGTNLSTAKCHLSSRSYPFLIAEAQASKSKFRSVACSGAVIDDIYGVLSYVGQNKRLNLLGIPESDIKLRQEQALLRFNPGEVRQIDFARKYKPSVISLGIGGNDVGLFDKLKSCLMPGECEWVRGDYLTQIGREIRYLFYKLTTLYSEIQEISSRDRLYAVGYPHIINPFSAFCDPITNSLLSGSEPLLIYNGISYLNRVIEAAARWAGIPYVSVENAFDGYALCDLKSLAMNAVVAGDDVNISLGSINLRIGNESFHPTPYGHRLLANSIGKSIDLISPKSGAAGGDTNTTIPKLPAYWQDDGRELPRLVKESLIVNEMIVGGNMMRIILGPGSFQPNSLVQLSIHSDAINLLSSRARDDGSTELEFRAPPNLDVGFHTIHVVGEDYNGQSVDYYQVLSYSNPDSNNEALLPLPTGEAETINHDEVETGKEVLSVYDHTDYTKNNHRHIEHYRDDSWVFWAVSSILLIVTIIAVRVLWRNPP